MFTLGCYFGIKISWNKWILMYLSICLNIQFGSVLVQTLSKMLNFLKFFLIIIEIVYTTPSFCKHSNMNITNAIFNISFISYMERFTLMIHYGFPNINHDF